jgi:hypothetical protein
MNGLIMKALLLSKIRKANIANKLGVSRAYVTQVLSKEENLTLKTISDFCRCCGYELDLKLKKISVHGSIPSIPDSMKWLFWDADFSRLDPVTHKRYILERILSRGNTEAVEWMRACYPKRQILNFINKNLSRMDARSLNYWALIYGKEEKWTTPLLPPKVASWQRLESANP